MMAQQFPLTLLPPSTVDQVCILNWWPAALINTAYNVQAKCLADTLEAFNGKPTPLWAV